MERTYIAIDLKSFYASVECVERGYDPLGTNLVVADESRTEKTICLAVSPSLKAYGIPGRPRLFEAMQSMAKHRLEPKRLRQVISRNGEKPWLCLIESRLGGKSGMTVEKDFVIYDASGNYTEEMESLLKLYREE